MLDLETALSPHFTVRDVVTSQTASRRGIDNLTPVGQYLPNAGALAHQILEKIVEHYGREPRITSWFRSPALNAAVRGASKSQHMRAEAVDHTIPGVSVKDHFNWLAFKSGLPFDQIIYEFGGWVHVSFALGKIPRQSILRIDHGTGYIRVEDPI